MRIRTYAVICTVALVGGIAAADYGEASPAPKVTDKIIADVLTPTVIVPQDVWTIDTAEVTGHPLICEAGTTASDDGTHCVPLPPVITSPVPRGWEWDCATMGNRICGDGASPATDPVPTPPDVTIYEDGSWRDAAGNTGCTPGALCDEG